MKKNESIFREWKIPGLQKVLRIMKLTVFLLLLSVISVFAGKSYSQTQVLNLDMKNSTVKEVLRNIEKQSEFVFMYSEKLIDVNREVSMNVKNKKINVVLDELFAGTNVEYKVKDRFILLITPEVTVNDLIIQQQSTVFGTVTDESGQPLPGLNVVVKGTTQGTVTNADGEYILANIPDDATLVFSFVGMLTQEVEVGSQSTINVTMVVDAIGIEEVVAVGYGTRKKKVVTGSISSVDSEEITARPVMNATEALQGRMSGVQVTTESGQPGSGVDIIVRGVSSNGNNTPLFIVDGVQMNNINYLSPQDIESIDVLKDAASAAIYGSRASNGVVIVSTKQGKKGEMLINYDGYVGIQSVHDKIGLLDAFEYMTLHNEGYVNDGTPEKAYPQSDFDNPRAVTDWQNEVFKSAPITNHSISLSGGNEKSDFSMSIGYFNQKGIVDPDKSAYQRITFGINSNHQFSKKLKIGQTLRFSGSDANSINEGGNTGILREMMIADPLTPVYETDPELLSQNDAMDPAPTKAPDGRYYGLTYKGYAQYNPLALLENRYQHEYRQTLLGNLYLDYLIFDDLKFNTSFGFNTGNSRSRSYIPKFYYSPAANNETTSASENLGDSMGRQWENTLNYTKTLDNSVLSVLVGNTILHSSSYWLTGGRNNMQIIGWDFAYVGNGVADDTQTSNSTRSEQALASFFGKINYDYKEKYLSSFIYRYDGSSRFGTNNKFGSFFSVQLGWNITEEQFMDDISFINNMKLRASFGQVGNDQIGNFQYLSLIAPTPAYPIGEDKTIVSGMAEVAMANPNLKWETTNEINIGIDLGMFDSKLLFVADFYNRTTVGLLGRLPVPNYVGLTSPIANLGDIRNTGVEFSLTYRKKVNNFYFSVSGNATYNINEVLKIDNEEKLITGTNIINRGTGNIAMKVGEPLPFIYGFKTDGIFQNQSEIDTHSKDGKLIQPNAVPGDIRFVDTNGDGEISTQDRVNIGNGVPDWLLGASFDFSYKNIGLNMFWQGQYGCDMINATTDLSNPDFVNLPSRYLDRWTGEGSTNNFPRMTHSDPNMNFRNINDMVHLENGSYLRLKSLNLSYEFEQSLLQLLGVQKLKVYLQGNNLLTFTNYSGFDPEVGTGIMSRGRDNGTFPQSRSYNFGINLTF
jgi:TonB-dependent starch-binding outer membrane protein SusC